MPAQVLATSMGKDLDGANVLDGVDLHLQGGITVILGPNGAGKTTLLRCLATVLLADRGELLIDGLDPTYGSDRIEIRRRLGYMPQEPGFHRHASVYEATDYIAILRGLRDDRSRRVEVFETLERVGLRDRYLDPVADLSGGMRRRLALGTALMGSPSLLVLDEPEAGLDPDERGRLRRLTTERRDRSTVVVSTHQTEEAAVADLVAVMASGAVRFLGSPHALAQRARGRTWVQDREPVEARAWWRTADGRFRCLGTPPPNAELVQPRLEDGYLLTLG